MEGHQGHNSVPIMFMSYLLKQTVSFSNLHSAFYKMPIRLMPFRHLVICFVGSLNPESQSVTIELALSKILIFFK